MGQSVVAFLIYMSLIFICISTIRGGMTDISQISPAFLVMDDMTGNIPMGDIPICNSRN